MTDWMLDHTYRWVILIDDLKDGEPRYWYKNRSFWKGSGVGVEMMHRIYDS